MAISPVVQNRGPQRRAPRLRLGDLAGAAPGAQGQLGVLQAAGT